MKLKYNAPVTLTFSFLCIIILAAKTLAFPYLVADFFTVPPHAAFVPTEPNQYLLLVSHAVGHADWSHLLSNLAFILLLGPLLEENYGSLILFIMMFTTAFITGVLNVCFSSQALLGASGIAFMMIFLSSFTNISRNELPLTFLLVLLLYLLKDVSEVIQSRSLASLAHIIGGICGSLFGLFRPQMMHRASQKNVQRKTGGTSKSAKPKNTKAAEVKTADETD